MNSSAANTPAPWSAPGWQHGRLRADGPSPATAGRRLVLKIGGSLLARSDWPRLVTALVAGAPQPARTLVVGGGAVVDGLRRIDAAAPQPADVMHALAIEAMRVTARLVAAAIDLPLSATPSTGREACVLDVPAWVAKEPRGGALPAGWFVTSDSIAASVAVAISADLLLAKSTAPPPRPAGAGDSAAVAAAGWVDDYFPIAAAGLDLIEWAAPR